MAATKTAAKKSASKKSAPKKTAASAKATTRGGLTLESVKRYDGKASKEPVAFAFLMQQHREVEAWFKAYEKAASDARKAELSAKICNALKVHTQIEEEILYPPAHECLSDEDLVDEAYVEHDGAKSLIAQIEAMKVGDHMYDAKVKVLSEYIKHHVKEEEDELFPEVEKKRRVIDLEMLGQRLKARSAQLMERDEDKPKTPKATAVDGVQASA